MIKLLIVDDSTSSRTDLKTMLDWEHHGFEIVGEAANGSEAIKRIRNELPDIIITDMNMPLMDGVKLIEYIKAHCPQVKIIALSAYDDYDFVRQSLKNGAVDYILKHQLHAGKLLELLQLLADEIKLERNKQDEIFPITTSKKVLRSELISMLLAGGISDIADIARKLQQLKLDIALENLMVIVAEIDDFWSIEESYSKAEQDVLINTILDIGVEIMNEWEKAAIVHIARGQFVMIFTLDQVHSKMFAYNQLFGLLNRIRSEMKRYLNITASFGASKLCDSITNLPEAYQEARLMLENKFYSGKNGIYMEHTEKLEDGFYCLDIKDEKEIYAALSKQDAEKVYKHIDHVFQNISNLRLRSHATRMVIAELISIVNKVCKDNGIDMTKFYATEDEPYNMIQKYETLSDIKQWIISLYQKLLSMLEDLRIDHSLSRLIRTAMAYIQKNYMHDISLTDAADVVGVSSPYLSKLFKEECGIGFSEYLNLIRIRNAKWYIEHSEYKLSEVARRVGYNNYNNFFKVFKKIEDITPLEYEKNCRNTG